MNLLPHMLLVLFMLNLGIASGAGLYEIRIVVPLWFRRKAGAGYCVNAEAMQKMDVGRRFWGLVTTLPLTLLTLINLFYAWKAHSPQHYWWLAATFLTLVERISTFTFFIPTALKLERADALSSVSVSRLATLWIRINYVRSAFNLLAWLFALEALIYA